MQNSKNTFLASLTRCDKDSGFISSFYERFLASSPEVREKFSETDFAVQRRMLLRSLRTVAGATVGEGDALQELSLRAETHRRGRLDIPPHLYVLWQMALVDTAAQFDSEWSTTTEKAWNDCLGYAVAYMVKRY